MPKSTTTMLNSTTKMYNSINKIDGCIFVKKNLKAVRNTVLPRTMMIRTMMEKMMIKMTTMAPITFLWIQNTWNRELTMKWRKIKGKTRGIPAKSARDKFHSRKEQNRNSMEKPLELARAALRVDRVVDSTWYPGVSSKSSRMLAWPSLRDVPVISTS